jgi:hypothetical protein
VGKRAALPAPTAHRRCQGRIIVLLHEFGTPVRWQCSVCVDEGVISNWEDSLFDLRRRRLTVVGAVSEIGINSQMIHDFLDDAAFVINEPIAARRTVFTPNSSSRYTSTAMQASSTSSSPPVRTVPNAAPVARAASLRAAGRPAVAVRRRCCGHPNSGAAGY